jgi:hypothetical protein
MEPTLPVQQQIDNAAIATAQLNLQAAQAKHQVRIYEITRAQNQVRPSSLYTPVLYHDGLCWVAWYGGVSEEVQKMLPEDVTSPGVKAMGSSPAEALTNFDKHWLGMELKDSDPE